MADSLRALAADLDRMPARDRRAILRALTIAEREAVEQAMLDRGDAVGSGGREPSGIFSVPFAQCIVAARESSGTTTATARSALLAAADALDPARVPVPKSGVAPGRSLLDAFGGMLSPRGRP